MPMRPLLTICSFKKIKRFDNVPAFPLALEKGAASTERHNRERKDLLIMLRRITAYLILISLVLVSVAPLTTFAATAKKTNNGQAQSHKLAPELESGAATGSVRVIIQTTGPASSDQEVAISKAGG